MCFIDLAEDTSATDRKFDRLTAAQRHLAEAMKASMAYDADKPQTVPGASTTRKSRQKSLMSVTSSTSSWDVVQRPSSSSQTVSRKQSTSYSAKEASDERAILSLLMGGPGPAEEAEPPKHDTVFIQPGIDKNMAEMLLQMEKHTRYVNKLLEQAQTALDLRPDVKSVQSGKGWRTFGLSRSEATQSIGGCNE